MKPLFKILGFFSALSIGAFIYFAWSIDSHLKERCEYLATTANNQRNIKYIQSWVNDVASGNNYQNVWSDDERTVAIVNGEVTNISSPEWEKIGLDSKYAHLHLKKMRGKYEELLSNENIETIEYGIARDSIVIKINHPDILNIRNQSESSGHFKKITNQVFVYCDGAKF